MEQNSFTSLQNKLQAISSCRDQNKKTPAYEKFLQFVIGINLCPNLQAIFEDEDLDGRNLADNLPIQQDQQELGDINTVLTLVLKEDMLEPEDLYHLWRVMREDTDIHCAVYVGLSQSRNNNLKVTFMEIIFSQLLKKIPDQVKDIDSQIISDVYGLYQDPEDKKCVLNACIENIGKERSTLVFLKILRNLIESHPRRTDNMKEFNQGSIIRFLCIEKKLLSKVLKELGSFVRSLNERIPEEKQKYFEINQRRRFLTFLTTSISDYREIMTYDVISNLWEIGLMANDFKDLQKQLFLLISQRVECSNDGEMRIEDLLRFIKKKVNSNECFELLKLTKEGFGCFRSIFIIVNQHLSNISEVLLLSSKETDFQSRFEKLRIRDRNIFEEDGDFLFQVDVVPHKLEGYAALWTLSFTENQIVSKKARDLLVSLYANINPEMLYSQIKEIREEYLSTCFKHLKIVPTDEASRQKSMICLELLHSFIDQTEKHKDTLKHPKLHSEFGTGEVLTMTIYYTETWYYGPPNNERSIKVHSNMLIKDLLKKITAMFETENTSIYLEERNSHRKLIVTDAQNTRTLADVGINGDAAFSMVYQNPPEAYLIQHDKTLNPKAKQVFIKWFESYSDNGKMGPQQCADFIHSCTNDHCQVMDRRVRETFREADDDKDGSITQVNFLDFYISACSERPRVVWSNLYAHKITSDLKPPRRNKEKKEPSLSLNVASLISSNDEYMRILFSLLESEDKIAIKALELLNRLPTNPLIFADIVLLKGVKDISDPAKLDWSDVLDINHIYKLFYNLNVVEYLMDSKRLDDNKDENEDVKILWSQDPRLLECKKTWFSDFLACGGYEHLNQILNKLVSLESNSLQEEYIIRIKNLIEAIDNIHILNMMPILTE